MFLMTLINLMNFFTVLSKINVVFHFVTIFFFLMFVHPILKSCVRPLLQVAYGIDRVQREAARVRDVRRRSREGDGVVIRGRHAGA